MAFTKTINYVQSVPENLNFVNEVSGTTGIVTVTIAFNSKAGRLNTEALGGISSTLGGTGSIFSSANEWSVSGTEDEVNAILNNLMWMPATYDDFNISQDVLAADRTYSEFKGEILIETENRDGLAAFNLQDTFKLNDGINVTEYTISAIDTDQSNYRLYGTLDESYGIADAYGPDYTNILPYATLLLDVNDVVIDNITDFAIVNPSGQYFLTIEVKEGNSVIDTGVVTLEGELFVKEPTFSNKPPASIGGNGAKTWTDLPMGEIAQADDDRVHIQMVLKRFEADPLFDGDVATNTPSYIEDNTYALFNEVRVDDRINEFHDTGIVRWSFYGTPYQCNQALEQLKIYTPPNPRDFFIETRVVNGRARIYHDRGYD